MLHNLIAVRRWVEDLYRRAATDDAVRVTEPVCELASAFAVIRTELESGHELTGPIRHINANVIDVWKWLTCRIQVRKEKGRCPRPRDAVNELLHALLELVRRLARRLLLARLDLSTQDVLQVL